MVEKIFVIAATLFSLVAVTMKKNWQIFALSAIANLLTGVSFLVLGNAKSGMSITVIAGVQGAIASFYAIKNKEFSIAEKLIFLVFYVIFGALNIKNIYDVLPFGAAMLCMMTLLQKNEQKIRMLNIINSITWIVYDFIVGSTAFYSQLLFLFMNVASIVAYKSTEVDLNDKR